MFIIIILFILFGVLGDALIGILLEYIFPVLSPMSITATDPAGFGWGIVHGLLTPANLFLKLIGKDVLIATENAIYPQYIIGFVLGLLSLLFLSPFLSSSKK